MKNISSSKFPPTPFENLRVNNLQGLGILDTSPDPFFDELIRLATIITETPIGAVSFLDHDRQWFKAKIGLDVSETLREDSFCTYTILHPSNPFIVTDATESATFKNNPLVVAGPEIRSYAGIPINSPDFGLTIGSLCVVDTKPRDFSKTQIKLLKEIAASIEVALAQKCAQNMFRRVS